MSASFEELDRRDTPIGVITVRRRLEPTLQVDVYEVKLDDEYLMSSLFTVAEIAVGDLAGAELPGTDLDVVVGGLGLGYTALLRWGTPGSGRCTWSRRSTRWSDGTGTICSRWARSS